MSGERASSLPIGTAGPSGAAAEPGPPRPPAPAEPRPPVDLRLVAVTPDKAHLVMEDSAGQQFRVPLDQRLATALRDVAPHERTRTAAQLEIALESQLSPREIQARIRSGQSLEEVSRAAGVAPDRVERYASPVIAEREHIVEQAQRTPGRRAGSGSAPALLDLVQARLTEQKASAEATEWDASRGDDEPRWTVRLSYLAAGRNRSASWTFDPRGRVLSPADDEARWLVDDSGSERHEDLPPAVVRRLASVPAGTEPVEDAVAAGTEQSVPDEVYDREADEARETARRQEVAAAKTGRRPPVPSFDDIMFGPRRHS